MSLSFVGGRRADRQIMSLELLAMALGLCTFSAECSQRRIRVFSDNVGAEYCVSRGSAKQWDHTVVVHSIWHWAAKIKATLWIERVRSA